jgi:hypothetical protein
MDGGMLGQVRPPQSIFKAQAQKVVEIGFKIPFNDGRIYVYSRANGDDDLVMGQLQQTPIVDATHDDCNLVIPTQGEVLDKELQVTLPTGHPTLAANALEGGWLLIDSGAAEGLVRRIKSHNAFTTGTAATVTFKFRDALDEVVAVSNTVKIIANPYNLVKINVNVTGGASNTGRVLGVAPIDVTKAYYFWLLVKGIGPGLNTNSTQLSPGDALCAAAAGVDIMTVCGDPLIGHAASYCAASDESLLVDYCIG